ncbi:hypothetical protein GC176_26025 [bacterium]|nr:hypothetical protein [bacterium]
MKPVAGLLASLLLVFLTGLLAPSPASAQKTAESGTDQKADSRESIDFNRARQLLQRKNKGEKLSADDEAYLQRAIEARRRVQGRGGEGRGRDSRTLPAAEKSGLKPLSEMTADDRYLGEDGGLYGQGRNEPNIELRRVANAALAKIQPLGTSGNPSADGRIVLVSISMSNATQEFSRFKQIADTDPDKAKNLTIVDCAQGGQAMAEWVDPDARPWVEAERRLERAGVTPEQVQVAWIKLANKSPRGDLQAHGRKLQKDTAAVIRNARAKFPNLRIVYLSSRIYGGYSAGPLNPEPFAYESAFAVRWLIQDQFQGNSSDAQPAAPASGADNEPVLLWGPYLWSDGVTPRKADGLVWKREDLGGDGTHPSQSGRDKVAHLLLDFFKADPLTRSWFTGRRE